jgi:type I restriction enzyme R subunit
MTSQNFEFLRPRRALLADLGGFAEAYAHSDPPSALLKMRTILEVMVDEIFAVYRLTRPYSENLNDLLNVEAFRQAVPEVVLEKLHAVRKAGNSAAHATKKVLTPALALERLQATYDLAVWFHLQIDRGDRAACRPYQAPPPAATSAGNGKAKEALEKLRLTEARYEAVLADLAEERKRRLAAEQAAAATEAENQARKAEGQAVAAALAFDELTTRRRLIDQELLDAGWDVGPSGASTEQVRQELILADGTRADYVLYGDDGKPLAVIEAKKTAIGCPRRRRAGAPVRRRARGRPPASARSSSAPTASTSSSTTTSSSTRAARSTATTRRTAWSTCSTSARTARPSPRRARSIDRRSHVPARSGQARHRAVLEQLPQGAPGPGHRHRQDPRRALAGRRAPARRLGQAHPVPVRPRELRRQADRVFKEHLPGEPRVIVVSASATADQRDKRIYLATYPAMMKPATRTSTSASST